MKIDTAHPRLRGERHERRLQLVHFPRAQSEFLFREHDDATGLQAFRRRASSVARMRRDR